MNAPVNNANVSALRQQQVAPREASLPSIAPGFGSLQSFELAMRQAKLLSASTLVPAQYRQIIEKKKGAWEENANAIPNCVIAMNMAQRMGADPLMVMQNLYIVEGRPSWSSQWIIAAINGCGRFSPLRFELKDLGEKEVEYIVSKWVEEDGRNKKVENVVKTTVHNLECTAWAIEKETGDRITSPAVSVEMAVKEGWYGKNGSKWQTMPEVMLRYRTASFFGKLYAPELLMGLQTVEEMQDIVIDAQPDGRGGYSVDLEALKGSPVPEEAAPDDVDTSTGEIIEGNSTSASAEASTAHASQGGEGAASSNPSGAPGFEDAIAAVKSGDFDLARDLARDLPAGQQQDVEQAIENRKNPEQQGQQRQRRERGGLGIE